MTDTIVDTSAPADATQNDAAAAANTQPVAAPATDKPTDKPAGNVLDTPAADDKTVQATWPEDWRDKLSKGDEKALKQFSRYASPEAMAEALLAAQKRISQGELGPKKPGKDSTPEEIAAYRELQGVPDKPESYFDKLPNGLVIGEDDKPLFDKFAALMHEESVPKGAVEKVVDWYYKEVVEEGQQARYEADRTAQDESMVKLREEYGMAYKAHQNHAENYLAGKSEGFRRALSEAAGPDGVSLLNNHEFIREIINIAQEADPVATVIPGGGSISTIDDQLAEIAKIQQANPKEYFTDAVQQRELKLLEAKAKLQSRA